MLLDKAITGLWLIRLNISPSARWPLPASFSPSSLRCTVPPQSLSNPEQAAKKAIEGDVTQEDSRGVAVILESSANSGAEHNSVEAGQTKRQTTLPNPLSLYPASILSSAMISRGEIGFLIASLAESKGTFNTQSGDETT